MTEPLLEWAFVVAGCWAADAFLVFVAVAWDAVDSAGRDVFFFVGEVFSDLKELGEVCVAYGIEFGSAYSFAASQGAFFG